MALLFLPAAHKKLPQRIIADMYKKYGWVREKKASSASPNQKMEFAQSLVALLTAHGDIKIDCIVVQKENVQPHIRLDSNKLYNYMCKLVICDQVTGEAEIEFIPDKRSLKVESGNSLSDYIQTVLWFESQTKTKLKNNPQESDRDYNLQFIDWVAHSVWSHFENGEADVFAKMTPKITVRKLFFSN